MLLKIFTLLILTPLLAQADLRCDRHLLNDVELEQIPELFQMAEAIPKRYQIPRLSMKRITAESSEYLTHEMSQETVSKVQKFVNSINTKSDEIIAFRGQTKLTQSIQSSNMREFGLSKSKELIEIDKKNLKQRFDQQYLNWENKRLKMGGRNGRYYYRFANDWNPDKTASTLSYFMKMDPIDLLAISHQSSLGSKHLISTTRDLSVAFGNFYMAPSNIRYVYILKFPKKVGINTYGASKYQTKSLGAMDASGLAEKEISIAHDATEYIQGVFDLETSKFISFD